MTWSHENPRLFWLEKLPRRPLCDVPWVGRSIIMSTGEVNFCCYSPVFVGNVREQPLEEIWNGSRMQQIRAALAKQQFPEECRTPTCPLWRGDRESFLLDRMRGYTHSGRGPSEWVRAARAGLTGSLLEARSGSPPRLRLLLERNGLKHGERCPLFVTVAKVGEAPLFFPEATLFPTPWPTKVCFPGSHGATQVDLSRDVDWSKFAPGPYRVDVALFEPNALPTDPSQCAWYRTAAFTLER